MNLLLVFSCKTKHSSVKAVNIVIEQQQCLETYNTYVLDISNYKLAYTSNKTSDR